MAFFINPTPDDAEKAQPEAKGPVLPLFQQIYDEDDDRPDEQLSLSAYISRHLGEARKGVAEELPKKQPAVFPTPVYTRASTEQNGQYMNTLDVELIAGLEQYMPTPLFRLRVTKKRLDLEISDLRVHLEQYERLQDKSSEMQGRMQAFRLRLATLEKHERRVSEALAAMLTMGALFHDLSLLSQAGNPLKTLWRYLKDAWLKMVCGEPYVHLKQANEELRDLQSVLSDRLKDPHMSEAELGQLLSRYDHLLVQAQRDQNQVSERFRMRGPIRLT